jgi:trans-aconitate methyltransferase
MRPTPTRARRSPGAKVAPMSDDDPGNLPLPELTRRLAEQPALWPKVRESLRQSWNRIAPQWEAHLRPDHLAPLEAALERVHRCRRALDLGTGTGRGARLLRKRFPDALVVGVDLAEEMVKEAANQGGKPHIRYVAADGATLPFVDGAFELITAVNVFIFWEEVTRLLMPGGAIAVEYSLGEATPIYLPVADVQRHLSGVGEYEFENGRAGRGIWILARKRPA